MELRSTFFWTNLPALDCHSVECDLSRAAILITNENKLLARVRSRSIKLENVIRDFFQSLELGALEQGTESSILFKNDQNVVIRPILANQSTPMCRSRQGLGLCRRIGIDLTRAPQRPSRSCVGMF